MVNYKNLMKVRKTIIEMLNDRGYDVSKYIKGNKYKDVSEDEVRKEYKQDNMNLITDSKKINTFFWDEEGSFSKMTKYLNKIKKNDLEMLILIIGRQRSDNVLSSSLISNISQIFVHVEVEIFYIDELVFNVTKHHYVPQHILLSKKEANIIYKAYGNDLPLLDKNDIISKYYGAKLNDVFKIIRPNNIYYRKIFNVI